MDWDSLCESAREALVIGDLRTYDHDPRFGLIVMAEVGSKALSSGVNDPGTVIDVITRIGRILSNPKDEIEITPEEVLEHIHVRPVDPEELLRDGFEAISRGGSGTLEVQQRLQQTLSGLMQHPDKGLRESAKKFAKLALQRRTEALVFAPDCDVLRNSADKSTNLDETKK